MKNEKIEAKAISNINGNNYEFQEEEESNNPNKSSTNKTLPIYDQLINKAGYNTALTKRIIISYIINIMFQGSNFSFIPSFYHPLKDKFQIKDSEMDLLSSIIFIGFVLSSLTIKLQQQYFSRIFLVKSHYFLLSLFYLIMILTNSYNGFLFTRFIIGINLGYTQPVMANLCAEFIPTYKRGLVLISLFSFYMLAYLFNLVSNLIFIGNYDALKFEGIENKLNYALISCFCYNAIMSFVVISFVENSPRDDIIKGEEKLGLDRLSRIIGHNDYDKNTVIKELLYGVCEEKNNDLDLESNDNEINIADKKNAEIKEVSNNKIEDINPISLNTVTEIENAVENNKQIQVVENINNNADFNQTNNNFKENKYSPPPLLAMFEGKYLRISLMNFCILGVSYVYEYGSMIVTPIIIKVINEKANIINKEILNTNDNEGNMEIDNNTYYSNLVIDQIKTCFLPILGYIICGLMVELHYLGRKRNLMLALIFLSLFSLLIIVFPAHFILLVSFLTFFIKYFLHLSKCLVSEVYPTKIRDSATGVVFFVAKGFIVIAMFLFLWLTEIHYLAPFMILFSISFISVFVVRYYPLETRKMPLDGH